MVIFHSFLYVYQRVSCTAVRLAIPDISLEGRSSHRSWLLPSEARKNLVEIMEMGFTGENIWCLNVI
jgi:hypothetical protein